MEEGKRYQCENEKWTQFPVPEWENSTGMIIWKIKILEIIHSKNSVKK